ncbi:uncharacterized protein LOC112523845 [Cynara cardunculus var. scolymus]|uniref:uncharacterized protein LOC112523845 n=1 Tax=Cynara cardunculus var. scolymus TaxID=59895 RepID=UPI000D62A069|nr:uncharacterized protein LOC112523845 [Cynara cardunculus var. scolymus]
MICEEIGGHPFCLLVDEARDESHKEQMSLVLRFVNKEGFIIERFFGLVHVRDTTAQTLKDGIYSLLSHYNLDVKSIRRQGYDGASNMQSASSKRTDQLRDAQVEQIAYLISVDELETGRGLNQIGTLQRAGDTLEHHYRVDIFYKAINCQLMELDHRFSDGSMEMLRLASTLDPKNAYETFRSLDVRQLVEKFYPEDFSDHERTILKMQLQHYAIDVVQHVDYKQLTSLAELGQWEVAEKISLEEIVEEFKVAKDRRVPL